MPLGTPRGTIIFYPSFFLFPTQLSFSSFSFLPLPPHPPPRLGGGINHRTGDAKREISTVVIIESVSCSFFLSWGGCVTDTVFFSILLTEVSSICVAVFFSLSRGHHWLWRRLRGRRGRGLRRRRGRGGRRAILRGRGLR